MGMNVGLSYEAQNVGCVGEIVVGMNVGDWKCWLGGTKLW